MDILFLTNFYNLSFSLICKTNKSASRKKEPPTVTWLGHNTDFPPKPNLARKFNGPNKGGNKFPTEIPKGYTTNELIQNLLQRTYDNTKKILGTKQFHSRRILTYTVHEIRQKFNFFLSSISTSQKITSPGSYFTNLRLKLLVFYTLHLTIW